MHSQPKDNQLNLDGGNFTVLTFRKSAFNASPLRKKLADFKNETNHGNCQANPIPAGRFSTLAVARLLSVNFYLMQRFSPV
jgi:hypothetical protein